MGLLLIYLLILIDYLVDVILVLFFVVMLFSEVTT